MAETGGLSFVGVLSAGAFSVLSVPVLLSSSVECSSSLSLSCCDDEQEGDASNYVSRIE